MRRYRGPRRVIFIGIYASASRARSRRAASRCATLRRARAANLRVRAFAPCAVLREPIEITSRGRRYRRVRTRVRGRNSSLFIAGQRCAILADSLRATRTWCEHFALGQEEESKEGERRVTAVVAPAVNIIYSEPAPSSTLYINPRHTRGFIFQWRAF